jgi:hypothetical protein
VPEEVVDHRVLHGRDGGWQPRPVGEGQERGERGELKDEADGADGDEVTGRC